MAPIDQPTRHPSAFPLDGGRLTELSKLVDQAVKSKAFVIAKAGKPLVKVVALDAPTNRNGWARSPSSG